MTCLLLRLAAPLQSWGTQSRFYERDTGLEPSKSGLIGLLCAATGTDRENDEALAPLANLKMGVRIDREGVFSKDFHTAGGGTLNGARYGVARASGGVGGTVISNRYYLSDAEFHVALSGDADLLQNLVQSLHNPTWPLFLGRKSFPPDPPLCLGLRDGTVQEVLAATPWRRRTQCEEIPERLRLVLECGVDEGAVRQDVPLSLGEGRRQFTIRHVRTDFCTGFPVVETLEELLSCT